MSTPRFGITELIEGQSGGDVVFNVAISELESMSGLSVLDRDLTAPPGGESAGAVYLVGGSATGAWSGHDGDIAIYRSGYYFVTPSEGLLMWVADENMLSLYDGAGWRDVLGWDTDHWILQTDIELPDAANIEVGTTTGTEIGTSAAQKLSFWGVTPVVQQSVLHGNTDGEIGGLAISVSYDQSEVQALRDKCEELADDVRSLRLALVTSGIVVEA